MESMFSEGWHISAMQEGRNARRFDLNRLQKMVHSCQFIQNVPAFCHAASEESQTRKYLTIRKSKPEK